MKRFHSALIGVTIACLLAACAPRVQVPAGTAQAGPTVAPSPTPPLALPVGRAVAADGQLVSPYPALPLGFGGGVSGQVLTITVKAGDIVQAGDLLARLDVVDLQRAVDDAQAGLDRARVDHERALSQWERDVAGAEKSLADAERALAVARLQFSDTPLEEARTALDRARQAETDARDTYEKALVMWPPVPTDGLYDGWQRAIRERELAEMRLADAEDAHDADYLALQGREEDVAAAERALAALEEGIAPATGRAVEDAERELERAQEALAHARLTAPWQAVVLSVDVAPGAAVGAGAPVVTLLNLEDGLCFATQNLSEQHVADIRAGQRAIVTLRAFPETPLEGVVESVIPQVGVVEGADARFAVRVRLSSADLRLLPGLTGRVEISTGE